jgi:hypothetical protein
MNPEWLESLLIMPDRTSASVAFSRAYVGASLEQKLALRAGWPFGRQWEYPTPSRLACAEGEDTSSYERIVTVLVLLSLETTEDVREHLVAYAVVWHSCLAAGLDPHTTFVAISHSLLDPTASQLRAFAERAPADQSMEAFGLTSRRTARGEIEINVTWTG